MGHAHLVCASRTLRLQNLLCVPHFEKNLISIKKLCEDNNVSVEFFLNTFFVKDLDSKITILMGDCVESPLGVINLNTTIFFAIIMDSVEDCCMIDLDIHICLLYSMLYIALIRF